MAQERVTFRKITRYALVEIVPQVSIRKISSYALVRDATTALTKGKSSIALLLELVNANSKGTVFTQTTLRLSNPTAENYQVFNTKVTASATDAQTAYAGSTLFRYNRAAITRHFINDMQLGITVSSNTTIYDLLAALNTAHNVVMTTDDVVDGPVLAGATGITLTAKSTSFLYLPGTTVRLGTAA